MTKKEINIVFTPLMRTVRLYDNQRREVFIARENASILTAFCLYFYQGRIVQTISFIREYYKCSQSIEQI